MIYLTQTAQVPKLLDGAKYCRKFYPFGLKVTDRHRRTAHAIGERTLIVIKYGISVLHPLLYNLFEILIFWKISKISIIHSIF